MKKKCKHIWQFVQGSDGKLVIDDLVIEHKLLFVCECGARKLVSPRGVNEKD